MHLLMSLFSGIGYLYGAAGLRNLLHESGVFAQGTAQQMLSGKDFDRALNGFKLVEEVLTGRLLIQFKKWCMQKEKIIPNEFEESFQDLNDAYLLDNHAQVTQIMGHLEDLSSEYQIPLLTEFRWDGRKASPTFAVWDEFLSEVMVPLLLPEQVIGM